MALSHVQNTWGRHFVLSQAGLKITFPVRDIADASVAMIGQAVAHNITITAFESWWR